MRQPVQVAIYCVGLRQTGWEYLLVRRKQSGGGYWQCITGGVEDNEDYYDAALRELAEETGFTPINIELIDYSYAFPVEEDMRRLYASPVDLITEIVFIADVDRTVDPRLDSKEHDSWQWCDFETALNMLYWPGNKESLRRCQLHMLSRQRPNKT
jgi:dATP pyrophosphohydrolase